MAWNDAKERQPARTGKYLIRRRSGKTGWINDRYYWNGSYWVTKAGSGTPAKGNLEWWESELLEKELQKEQEGQENVSGAD